MLKYPGKYAKSSLHYLVSMSIKADKKLFQLMISLKTDLFGDQQFIN